MMKFKCLGWNYAGYRRVFIFNISKQIQTPEPMAVNWLWSLFFSQFFFFSSETVLLGVKMQRSPFTAASQREYNDDIRPLKMLWSAQVFIYNLRLLKRKNASWLICNAPLWWSWRWKCTATPQSTQPLWINRLFIRKGTFIGEQTEEKR